MAGIYIHIPYCKQKCHYCNFYSFASKQYRNEFVDALLREIVLRKEYPGKQEIGTIYFGGGTPSMLSAEEVNQIIRTITNNFIVSPNVEITLEANPDDMNKETLSALRDTPVNRLSMGIQSFFDDDLVYLNRVHNGKHAIRSIELALKYGFTNLTIDLIYGIPTLTEKKWLSNLERFFSFNLPHLSSYSLTVEPGTALNKLIRKGKMQNVNEQQSISHFRTLIEKTREKGFIHYEISNFAKEGFYSKHNSIYWVGGRYLGLGPSAHSFNGHSRQWNVSNMKRYIESDTIEKIVEEKENLSEDQQFNEYIMTSLRTSWGCDLVHIKNVFGKTKKLYFERSIQPFIEAGKVRNEGSVYILTDHGKLFVDGIAADLFI